MSRDGVLDNDQAMILSTKETSVGRVVSKCRDVQGEIKIKSIHQLDFRDVA